MSSGGTWDSRDYFRYDAAQLVNPFNGTEDQLVLGINPNDGGEDRAWIMLGSTSNYLTREGIDELVIALLYMKEHLDKNKEE